MYCKVFVKLMKLVVHIGWTLSRLASVVLAFLLCAQSSFAGGGFDSAISGCDYLQDLAV